MTFDRIHRHPGGHLLLLRLSSRSVPLGIDTLQSSLTGGLGLRTLSIHLLLEDALALLLSLGLVNLKAFRQHNAPNADQIFQNTYMFNQSALVFEGVTLAQLVQLVVQVLVNLAGGAVLDEETAENALATHPKDLAVELQFVSDPISP